MLNQFTPEGLRLWEHDIEVLEYPLAVIQKPVEITAREKKEPTEIFRDLFREIVWVNQTLSPALYSIDGIRPMTDTLTRVAYEQSPFEDIGILNGTLYRPDNGIYTPKSADLFFPFDYSHVAEGIIMQDYNDAFALIASHSRVQVADRIPPLAQFSLITTQDAELRDMQQLRMQFYDVTNYPCSPKDSYTVVGDIITLEDGNVMVDESFVLKQHPHKPLFYRDVK